MKEISVKEWNSFFGEESMIGLQSLEDSQNEEITFDDEEQELADQLEEQGYQLGKMWVPGFCTPEIGYYIADMNNVMVTGETPMTFEEVERWIAEG